MAEDAFGNDTATVAPPEPEVTETDTVTPQGTVYDVQEPEPTEEEGSDDWTMAIEDPELRQAVGAKYGSPTELAKAYKELEGRFGSQGNEIAELRQMVTELMSGAGQPQDEPAPNGQGQQAPTFEAVAQWAQSIAHQIDQGEVEPGRGMAAIVDAMAQVSQAQMSAREEQLMAQIEERLGQELAPVHSTMTQQRMGGKIAAMQRQYGEDYDGYARRAAELLREWGRIDPRVGEDPRYIETAFEKAELEAERQRRRESQAHTLDGTGPGPAARSVDPAAMILEGIERAGENMTGGYF